MREGKIGGIALVEGHLAHTYVLVVVVKKLNKKAKVR